MIIVATFYKFTQLDNLPALRQHLMDLMHCHGIKGTIILANEGINGTVAAPRTTLEPLKQLLLNDERFFGMEYKEASTDSLPFKRVKIHIKKEIVTLGRSDIKPNQISGIYVEPQHWNELIRDPDVTILDVRNNFEVKLGSFHKAINPKTRTFRDFATFVEQHLSPTTHKKIAMSCTGGIRCEKASALMKTMGFTEVYQLQGGILRYLKEIPREKSLWRGDCFVFDERFSVNHDHES
jgi:UPF0176 protein